MNTSLFHLIFYLCLNSSVSILREDSLLLKKALPPPLQSLVKRTGKTMADGNEKLLAKSGFKTELSLEGCFLAIMWFLFLYSGRVSWSRAVRSSLQHLRSEHLLFTDLIPVSWRVIFLITFVSQGWLLQTRSRNCVLQRRSSISLAKLTPLSSDRRHL